MSNSLLKSRQLLPREAEVPTGASTKLTKPQASLKAAKSLSLFEAPAAEEAIRLLGTLDQAQQATGWAGE